jgi:hypothetical protein
LTLHANRCLLLTVLCAVTTLPVTGCARDSCGNDLFNEYQSPDRQHKVVVFRRSCGATTGFSVHASVLSTGDPLPSDGGNAFVAEDLRDPAQAAAISGAIVRVEWRGPSRVFLGHGFFGKVFKAERKIGGVSIDYEDVR